MLEILPSLLKLYELEKLMETSEYEGLSVMSTNQVA
jgi:hypothetical protein